MKVGDYVRFKFNGEIGKVSHYEYDDTYENGHHIRINNEKNGVMLTDEEFKSSPNIIDLIEVGDYVNGNKVDYVSKNGNYVVFYDGDGDIETFEDDIKSIVTKEQFESMEYKIGEC